MTNFSVPAAGQQARIVIDPGGANEICTYTGITGSTLTGVTKGAESTTDAQRNDGLVVIQAATAGALGAFGPLSGNTPQAVGTAAAGTGTLSSKDDHVHALSTLSAEPAGDTAITLANTNYDLCSISCPAGVWVFMSSATLLCGATGGGNCYLRIWDGSTVYGHQAISSPTLNSYYGMAVVTEPITLGSTTTVKLTGRSTSTTKSFPLNPDSIGNSPILVAIRVG